MLEVAYAKKVSIRPSSSGNVCLQADRHALSTLRIALTAV